MPIAGVPYRRALLRLAATVAAFLLLTTPAWAAPANDAFSNATALSATLPTSVAGSNVEAGKEAGEPDHAGDAGGHSVWYSWTPSSSGPVGIKTSCFSGLHSLIAVYTGTAVGSLTPVADNKGSPPPNCFNESGEVAFNVTAGTTYRIAIDGVDGAQGSFELLLDPPPANDDFVSAETLATEPPISAFASNRLSDKQVGEPNHAGELGGHSVWYSWTPSTGGQVEISTCAPFSNIDSLLAVYTGSGLDSLSPVAANDDGPSPALFPECKGTDSEVRFDATAGTTYRIAVDGASGTVGKFTLRIRGRPGNDDFANPDVLAPSLPTNATFGTTIALATKETGEPDHAGNPGGHSVWYSWTPSAGGPVAITACGSTGKVATVLAVYTGSDLGALSPIAANDGAAADSCPSNGSEVQFAATAGTTYRIAVDGKDGGEGRISLGLEGGPGNDAFANGQALSPSLSSSGFANSKLAGKEAGEPNHAGNPGGHSVWYSWTPSSSGLVEISACPYIEGTLDTLLAVYTGGSVDGLTPVAANDDGAVDCDETASGLEFAAVAGTTYRIAVDGKADSSGLFSLQIQHALPQNDDFAAAEALDPNPSFAGGSTKLAGKEAGEPDHAGNPGGHSVWYLWTSSAGGPVSITSCGTNGSKLDTLLAVYTGSPVNALTPVAANDDAVDPPSNELCSAPISEVKFDAVAGTTYRIAVDGKGGSTGRFMLAFERGPEANDDFSAADGLQSSLSTSAPATNRFASKEVGEPDHAGNPGGHSVWYSWTAPSSGPVAIFTCTNWGGIDALLAVYTGSAVGSLTPVASNDDGGSDECLASDSEVQITAAAGTTYRIAVDGKGGSTGQLQVFLEGAVTNDDFGQPQPLSSQLPARFFFGSNRFAGKQAGEPDHAGDAGGHSVWYKWTAPRSGEVSVDACAGSFDALVAVYTGTAVDSLTSVASETDSSSKCGPESRLSFDAIANTVYKIAVDGKGGAEGSVNLTIDAPPANDEFGEAESIRAKLPAFLSEGSTLLAGKEAGEPDHAGDGGGHSVWYSWTPSSSGLVEISACTSTFDPVLAVYTGSAVDSLSPVGTAEIPLSGCKAGRSVRFDAAAGTTYRIAVDGAAGDDGHFELQLEAATVKPRALTVSRSGAGSGSVTSSPAGIACGATCSHDFKAGIVVTLLAHPDSGSFFAGWSGGGCSGTGSCQVTLGADTTVVASFQAASSGGGGGVPPGGGGGVPLGPGGAAQEPAPKPPLRCKPGFRKVRVKGKPKCVKRKKAKHGRSKGKRRPSRG